jgi:hypothetical protein
MAETHLLDDFRATTEELGEDRVESLLASFHALLAAQPPAQAPCMEQPRRPRRRLATRRRILVASAAAATVAIALGLWTSSGHRTAFSEEAFAAQAARTLDVRNAVVHTRSLQPLHGAGRPPAVVDSWYDWRLNAERTRVVDGKRVTQYLISYRGPRHRMYTFAHGRWGDALLAGPYGNVQKWLTSLTHFRAALLHDGYTDEGERVRDGRRVRLLIDDTTKERWWLNARTGTPAALGFRELLPDGHHRLSTITYQLFESLPRTPANLQLVDPAGLLG